MIIVKTLQFYFPLKACSPVMARPRMSAWMSCVPVIPREKKKLNQETLSWQDGFSDKETLYTLGYIKIKDLNSI